MEDRFASSSKGECSIEPTIRSNPFVKLSSTQSFNEQLPSPSGSSIKSNTSDRQSSPSPPSSSFSKSASKERKLSANNITSIPLNSSTSIINLQELIKAGTLHLPHYSFTIKDPEEDEDKWHILSPHLLSLEDIVMQDSVGLLPTPPCSPNKGKAKAYSQEDPDLLPPEISNNDEPTEISSFDTVTLLQKILKLQDYFTLVAEAKEARFTAGIILRIYLVPLDYHFVDEEVEKLRWSKKRPSVSALTSVISRLCLDTAEWERAILGGKKLRLLEHTVSS